MDTTIINDPNGNFLGTAAGDQTTNPLYLTQGVDLNKTQAMPRGATLDIPGQMQQLSKDAVVNAASEAPLLIPGLGPLVGGALRAGGSLAAGYGADTLLNPDKTPEDKTSNAMLNTAIGMILPEIIGKIQNFSGIKVPGIRTERFSTVSQEPTVTKSAASTEANAATKSVAEANRVSSGTSSTANKGASSNAGNFESVQVRKPFENIVTDQDAITNIQKELDRVQGINTSKMNPGQAKQVGDYLERLTNTLDALQEGTSDTGVVTRTKGSSSGQGTREGSSNSQSSSQSNAQTNRNAQTDRTTSSDRESVTEHGKITRHDVSIQDSNDKFSRLLEAIRAVRDSFGTGHPSLSPLKKSVYSMLGKSAKDIVNEP